MKEKLSFKQNLLIGSLLFGLFFGAGNLIFPVQMGQQAGKNTFIATIGFLITGVGLPILGIIASSLSKSESLFDIDNGGSILSMVSNHYFGFVGKVLLAAIVGIACVKTAIGLLNIA